MRDNPPTWHPLLAAVERAAGTWYMVAQFDNCYGVIQLVRRGTEIGYRVTTWAEKPEERKLVGYYRTLRAASEAAHSRFLRSHGSTGPPNGTWVWPAPD